MAEEQKFIDQLQKEVQEKYGTKENLLRILRTQYVKIFLVSEGFERLRGKKVLDLGCGSIFAEKDVSGIAAQRQYEPWFARLAKAAGADVIGIDIQPNDTEEFTHVRKDLTKPSVLAMFPDCAFDIVNSSAFLVPHGKMDTSSRGLDITSPTLYEILRCNALKTEKDIKRLDEQINAQVERILKEGGWYIYNEELFVKRNGKLEKVPLDQLMRERGPLDLPTRL